jgi:hypothetical protein
MRGGGGKEVGELAHTSVWSQIYLQSNLVKRDVKITAKQSRLEQNPF